MKIVIFGCGGHARSILNTLLDNDRNTEIIIVDKNAKDNEKIMGFVVYRDYELEENDAYIIAVGNNDARRKMHDSIKKCHYGKCVSVISCSSYMGMETHVGTGTFIAPHAYVGPQAKIGNNTIINTGSVIEHETVIGDYTHIAPHATICGRSRIGNNVFCGAGSTVIDRISICENVVIGAGAVVVNDILEAGTYVGVPAKKI